MGYLILFAIAMGIIGFLLEYIEIIVVILIGIASYVLLVLALERLLSFKKRSFAYCEGEKTTKTHVNGTRNTVTLTHAYGDTYTASVDYGIPSSTIENTYIWYNLPYESYRDKHTISFDKQNENKYGILEFRKFGKYATFHPADDQKQAELLFYQEAKKYYTYKLSSGSAFLLIYNIFIMLLVLLILKPMDYPFYQVVKFVIEGNFSLFIPILLSYLRGTGIPLIPNFIISIMHFAVFGILFYLGQDSVMYQDLISGNSLFWRFIIIDELIALIVSTVVGLKEFNDFKKTFNFRKEQG